MTWMANVNTLNINDPYNILTVEIVANKLHKQPDQWDKNSVKNVDKR